jgi:hypothetical protein
MGALRRIMDVGGLAAELRRSSGQGKRADALRGRLVGMGVLRGLREEPEPGLGVGAAADAIALCTATTAFHAREVSRRASAPWGLGAGEATSYAS